MIYIAAGLVALIIAALGVRLVGWGRKRRAARPQRRIVVDGSNVMHWGDGHPSLQSLGAVIQELQGRGFAPQVFFDANIGYKLAQRHMSAGDLARKLPVTTRQITIVPGGQPADPYLIAHAKRHKCRIVSNDRFRDWRGDYPILRNKKTLVTGGLRGRRVELRF